jgi:hypothetical protein
MKTDKYDPFFRTNLLMWTKPTCQPFIYLKYPKIKE